MMNFREATRADRDAILALRAQCFGDDDPEKRDPRFWDWEFARARMFVGEEDGRLATHIALVELPGNRALAVDAMTAPWARGRGAFSKVVAHAMQSTSFAETTAYQIRSAVLGSMLRGGFAVAGRAPVLLRPVLFPRNIPVERRPLRAPEDDGGRSGRRSTGNGDVSTLTRNDVGLMAKLSGRAPEFLAWRFFDNPLWQYDVIGDEDGYLVGRKTILKGIHTYAVVDLAWRDARAARRLLRAADTRGCRLMAALASPSHRLFRLLLTRGFVPGPHWFRILVRPPELASRAWPVTWADTDHL